MKTYDSVNLAKYLVSLAVRKGKPLNMTKLQKLLFILYGYYLSTYNHKIISEEPKAWPFGPVFPNVHKRVDYTEVIPLEREELKDINADEDLKKTLNLIVDRYAKYSATELSNWSHMQGSPWDRATQSPYFKWNFPIDDQYINEYFSAKKVL